MEKVNIRPVLDNKINRLLLGEIRREITKGLSYQLGEEYRRKLSRKLINLPMRNNISM